MKERRYAPSITNLITSPVKSHRIFSHKNFATYTVFPFGAYTHLQTFPEQLYNTALSTWRNAARRRKPGWFGLGWAEGGDLPWWLVGGQE